MLSKRETFAVSLLPDRLSLDTFPTWKPSTGGLLWSHNARSLPAVQDRTPYFNGSRLSWDLISRLQTIMDRPASRTSHHPTVCVQFCGFGFCGEKSGEHHRLEFTANWLFYFKVRLLFGFQILKDKKQLSHPRLNLISIRFQFFPLVPFVCFRCLVKFFQPKHCLLPSWDRAQQWRSMFNFERRPLQTEPISKIEKLFWAILNYRTCFGWKVLLFVLWKSSLSKFVQATGKVHL